jgi:hypothetical protein
MGSGGDLRDRLWRERLITALRQQMSLDVQEAESLAGLVLVHGIPPGQDEAAIRDALGRSFGATPAWVEEVMAIVTSLRDGIRLADPHLERSQPGAEERPAGALTKSPLPQGGAPDHEVVLPLILERLRAVNRFRQLAPHIQAIQQNLRTLRVAVAAEADDSVRLPRMLAEWLEARRTWEAHSQLLQSAQATLRSTEWLIPFLSWPHGGDED